MEVIPLDKTSSDNVIHFIPNYPKNEIFSDSFSAKSLNLLNKIRMKHTSGFIPPQVGIFLWPLGILILNLTLNYVSVYDMNPFIYGLAFGITFFIVGFFPPLWYVKMERTSTHLIIQKAYSFTKIPLDKIEEVTFSYSLPTRYKNSYHNMRYTGSSLKIGLKILIKHSDGIKYFNLDISVNFRTDYGAVPEKVIVQALDKFLFILGKDIHRNAI